MKISKLAMLIAGFTAGIITGLLVAPESGKKTRNELKKKGKKYKKYAEEKAEELKKNAISIKDNVEGAAQDVKKRFS